ncbi:MAG: AEC family transporter [Acetivibrionales bacterium]|jgi:predicted permease
MVFFNSIGSIFTIIIIIGAGYILTRVGWFNESTGSLFSRMVLNISLPCYLLYNITSTFERDELIGMAGNLATPVISIGVSYILSIAASYILRVDRSRRGVYRSMFFASNAMFIGLPVNIALFGEESVPYVLLYYLANTSIYWTIGVYEISGDNPETRRKLLSAGSIRRVFNPAICCFLAGVAIVLAGFELPKFIHDSLKYIGNMTTPLAMFFTGIALHSVKWDGIRVNKDMISLVIARSVICPVLIMLLNRVFLVPEMMGAVFVIQAAMPVITSTSVVAKVYGSDYKFAAVMSAVTTATSLVVIPFYMWFMGR